MSNPDGRLTIRLATPADDRELAELDTASWPLELQVTPPQPASEPFFGDRRRPSDVLVADSGGETAGYGRLARHLSTPSNDQVLHLDALVVSPSMAGRGVGTAVIAEARRRGARKLGLRALSTNERAIFLYRRAGFKEEDRLKDEIRLPDGSYADDVWFALRLT